MPALPTFAMGPWPTLPLSHTHRKQPNYCTVTLNPGSGVGLYVPPPTNAALMTINKRK